MKTLHNLTLHTNIPHQPSNAQKMRSEIIEHMFVTFLLQLRPQYPKLFTEVKAKQILNRIFGKNNGNISVQAEESIDNIIQLLYERYPDIQYFHNHPLQEDRGVQYPRIQYRCHRRKLVIVVLQEAIPIVETWLSKADWNSWITYKNIVHKKESFDLIKILEKPLYYRLMDWVAMNSDNYQEWQHKILLKDRLPILERALTGQMRRVASSFIEDSTWENITAELVTINQTKSVQGYHHKDIAFNVICRSNIQLPPCLAIGKSISIGYGTLSLTRWQGEVSRHSIENNTEQLVYEPIL